MKVYGWRLMFLHWLYQNSTRWWWLYCLLFLENWILLNYRYGCSILEFEWDNNRESWEWDWTFGIPHSKKSAAGIRSVGWGTLFFTPVINFRMIIGSALTYWLILAVTVQFTYSIFFRIGTVRYISKSSKSCERIFFLLSL